MTKVAAAKNSPSSYEDLLALYICSLSGVSVRLVVLSPSLSFITLMKAFNSLDGYNKLIATDADTHAVQQARKSNSITPNR